MIFNLGKFAIHFVDGSVVPKMIEDDSIRIGRLDTCDVLLDDPRVSRVHAAINFTDEGNYTLVNLSTSNTITLNGRLLGPQATDVLADGDTIQIGPFLIEVGRRGEAIILQIQRAVAGEVAFAAKPKPESASDQPGGVLDVFWEKRSREKEDWGSRLRPTEKPRPGKAMFNWRPTLDLRRPWRFGLFVWAVLIVGAIAAYAYYRYPQVYAPKPLANPHVVNVESSIIAATANGNSCTTCHTLNQPIENACIRCHSAEGFHASNTKAHNDAGITCTVCHREHQGSEFSLVASAIESCAQCHSDNNRNLYNGKAVHTAHNGSYGYPVTDGKWKWQGIYREVADAIPEIQGSAIADKDDQARLSREFHAVHAYRLTAPQGLTGDKNGLVSCSTCHKSFNPIDRSTPRQTCAVCHTTPVRAENRDQRFVPGQVNCISCHVQHPYSKARWSEFLSEDALKRRNDAVAAQIKSLEPQ